MEITEVRVKLVPPGGDKLRAFCSITFDDQFVVRDVKIIEGQKGAFVAMPSRKLTSRCSRCSAKNHDRARFCNDCGGRLPVRASGAHGSPGYRPFVEGPLAHDGGGVGRPKLHADVAHPINSSCREMIQGRVLEVYFDEVERSKAPGYRPVELDDFDEDLLADQDELAPCAAAGADGRRETGGQHATGEREAAPESRGRHGGRDDGEPRVACERGDGTTPRSESSRTERRRDLASPRPTLPGQQRGESEREFGAGLLS